MQRNYNHISIPTWAYRQEPTTLHLIYTVYIVSERSQFQGYMTTTAFENNRMAPGRIFSPPCPEAVVSFHYSPAHGLATFSAIYAKGCPRTQVRLHPVKSRTTVSPKPVGPVEVRPVQRAASGLPGAPGLLWLRIWLPSV